MIWILVKFGASLLAIAALVVLAHYLGFTRAGRLESEEEAAELLGLAAGGFDPDRVLVDRNGLVAFGEGSDGRLAVLKPHGGQFVARILSAQTRLEIDDEALRIEDPALGPTALVLRFDHRPEDWVAELVHAR